MTKHISHTDGTQNKSLECNTASGKGLAVFSDVKTLVTILGNLKDFCVLQQVMNQQVSFLPTLGHITRRETVQVMM